MKKSVKILIAVISVIAVIALALLLVCIVNILFGAAVKDYIPEGKAGLFQGIRMIFVVLIPLFFLIRKGLDADKNKVISEAE